MTLKEELRQYILEKSEDNMQKVFKAILSLKKIKITFKELEQISYSVIKNPKVAKNIYEIIRHLAIRDGYVKMGGKKVYISK